MTTNNGRAAPPGDDIAVIGMQGRFPGARNVDELWANLKAGQESIVTFSEAELRAAGIDEMYFGIPGFVNRGSVLEDIEQFDAGFFGYSARDAETMDPQQRVFLECAWESLERAGCNPDTYPGMIGVFAGGDQSTYLYQIYANVDLSAYGYGGMMSIGNEKDYLTTQVSYKLNLRGPSLDVQTSCSTSLVAVCMACQNLRHGYCDVALAGGVAIGVPQRKGYWYQPGGILSPDGHCRPFDADGQGTVVGNGVGVVVLKRLADAVEDGDNILAVIKGFAINNDGAAKVGYTAPGIEGQSRAIEMAHSMAGIEPDTIGYVEAHGTATALGDPVEMAALTKAFRRRTDKKQFCAVGSLKGNVGHLSSAAGVAGLIKTVLTVGQGQIPPSLHFRHENPQLSLERSPFYVAAELRDWPPTPHPRRAGVSSFGVGGTNAHLVLEEPPLFESSVGGRDTHVLVLSARTATALEATTDNLVAHLRDQPEANVADVAFTLQAGRKVFPHRRAVVFHREQRGELIDALATRDPARVLTTVSEVSARPVIFLFSGQGTQYVGMGRGLYRTEPIFREHLDHCAEILKGEIGFDIRGLLYDPADPEAADERLRQTDLTQPALFAIEYALARLWMEWGVRPRAMVGHSIGEYVAACLAGVMSLEQALSVVSMRGRLMASMPEGRMLAVALPEAALQPVLRSDISLAAVNAPMMSVLAGPAAAMDALEAQFLDQSVPCRKLHTSHAFHSAMMEPVLAQFAERMRRIELNPPQLPYLSNLTGSWMTPDLATSPDYWAHHLRQTVRFADNLREVMAFPDLALVEVGPGQTLGFLANQQGSRRSSQLILSSLPGPQEKDLVDDADLLTSTVAQMWLGGVELDWRGFHRGERRRRLVLPTYPFERQRYWLGPLEEVGASPARLPDQPAAPGPAQWDEPMPSAAVARASNRAAIADWTYVPVWKPAVNPGTAGAAGPPTGSWLVLADRDGLAAELTDRLRADGFDVHLVLPGEAFARHDAHYEIRPGERLDYDTLLQDVKQRGDHPSHVLHLWSVADPPGGSPSERFEASQTRSFYSLVFLAQALSKANATAPVQIGVVTQGLQSVFGDEALRSNEATVLGAAKVISQEYPQLRCRSIDVGGPEGATTLIGELLHEPFHAVVAYRNGRRWIEQYEPVRLEDPQSPPKRLADGDVVLVTGGLGNIGLLLVEAMAAAINGRFVLTGRSAFPERDEWDAYVERNPADATAATIRRLTTLERAGSEVVVVRADVADPVEMRAAVEQAVERWGAVNGVVHAAANLSPEAFGAIGAVDRQAGDDHFRAKALGLIVLSELLADQPVKFYFLLSSLSAVLGGLGLACYAASNAYLDAAARQRNREDRASWITVDWDSWSFAPASRPTDGIGATEGQDCFRRIMASALQHVVVSTTPLADRLARWVELPASPAARTASAGPVSLLGTGGSTGPAPASVELHARPALSSTFTSPRTETERTLVGVWEHLLGVTPIGVHDKFFELGGHSLLAVQVLARLRETYDLDIPVQLIFEAPTIADLAGSIDQQLQVVDLEERDPSLDETLKLIEGLSDEEVEALLMQAEELEALDPSDG